MAHRANGGQFFTGAYVEALLHFEWIAEHFDVEKHGSLAYRYGQDPGAAGLSLGCISMWLRGYPDTASNWARGSLSRARDSSHQLSRAYSHTFVAIMHPKPTRLGSNKKRSRKSGEHGFSLFLAWANIIKGWVLAQEGRTSVGIELMHSSMSDSLASGTNLFLPYFLVLLAESNGESGHIDEALAALDQGLAEAGETGERAWEAEVHRLRGELLWEQGEAAAVVESHYQRALDVSRLQDAKSLELRAATSLSRLWDSQGRTEEARKMLAEIYNWFTEGFETADLREAKALLSSLSA